MNKIKYLVMLCGVATMFTFSHSLSAKTAGEKLDRTIENASDKYEDAKENAKDNYNKRKDQLKDKYNDALEKSKAK